MTNEEYLTKISQPRAIIIMILKNAEIEGQLSGWFEDSNVITNLCIKHKVTPNVPGCKTQLHKKMLLDWLKEESGADDE